MSKASAPKISIALCVHNGARYLTEQLESLRAQTCPLYELVVCDDASEDASASIVEAFADGAPFPVRFYRNLERLGVGANFEQAIRLCQGELIFLCDQDDVWSPVKVECFIRAFSDNPEAVWAFCNAEVVDAGLQPIGYSLWQRILFTLPEQILANQGEMLSVLLRHSVVAGASLAFRAELREMLLPIPSGWLYDTWLSSVLATLSPPALISETLQHYRQHDANCVGGMKKKLLVQVCEAFKVDRKCYLSEELSRWDLLAKRFAAIRVPSECLDAVGEKLRHLERRARLPQHRLLRFPAIGSEILRGGYLRYSRNWGSVALDLLFK